MLPTLREAHEVAPQQQDSMWVLGLQRLPYLYRHPRSRAAIARNLRPSTRLSKLLEADALEAGNPRPLFRVYGLSFLQDNSRCNHRWIKPRVSGFSGEPRGTQP